jgi:hypothetical protein
MRRRQEHRPHHESPHEQRLREIVDEVVPDGPQKPAYLQFARELVTSMHRAPDPDFSRRTKRIVGKWFRRGMSGHALWRIGEALIGFLFSAGK